MKISIFRHEGHPIGEFHSNWWVVAKNDFQPNFFQFLKKRIIFIFSGPFPDAPILTICTGHYSKIAVTLNGCDSSKLKKKENVQSASE